MNDIANILKTINHGLLKPNYIKLHKQVGQPVPKLVVDMPFACIAYEDEIKYFISNHLLNNGITDKFDIEFNIAIIPHKVKPGLVRVKNIKNVIAVTSGKGGVGKSTIAINLAISLAKNGAKVGLLDADIYGPSVPILVGDKAFKPDVEDKCFLPLEKYNIKILSFGFLVAEKQPAIWRGAIVAKALDQMFFDTKWGELDYLVIDMPPGTGDIHLTMCQKMPITATVAVTTPQDVALLDVTKSIEMYQKMSIPCLGVIENMSSYVCNNCGHIEHIFGDEGANRLSQEYNLAVLGKLPLNLAIRQGSDEGVPISTTDNPIAQLYLDIATKVAQNLSELAKDYSANIGKINTI